METALIILASILILAGIIGNILPALPGTPLSFAALLILQHTSDGEAFSVAALVVFGILTLCSLTFDFVLPMITARRFGASGYGLWGSFLGMVVGLILFPPLGALLGLIAGAVGGELLAGKRSGEALKAGAATVAGNIAAVVLRLGLSLTMAAMFVSALI
ncbi:MAG: DUF456 domain-containing protein [Thermodesulfovibrionales bacterium]|nr:DUF456 domain-containing protein [Thermodesulfovibrionales bacterium]